MEYWNYIKEYPSHYTLPDDVQELALSALESSQICKIAHDSIFPGILNPSVIANLVYASEYKDTFLQSQGFGWQFEAMPKFDWHHFMQAKNKELDRLQEIYKSNLSKANVKLFAAKATLKLLGRM